MFSAARQHSIYSTESTLGFLILLTSLFCSTTGTQTGPKSVRCLRPQNLSIVGRLLDRFTVDTEKYWRHEWRPQYHNIPLEALNGLRTGQFMSDMYCR